MLEKLWSALEYGFQSKYFLIIFIVCIVPIIAKWFGADELISKIKDEIFGISWFVFFAGGVYCLSNIVDIVFTGTLTDIIIKIAISISLLLIFIDLMLKELLFSLVVCGFVIYSLVYDYESDLIYKITVYISPVLLYLIYEYIIKPIAALIFNYYKIRTLKSMERIIKKYIKKNGYQSIWRFDNFICTRYKRKVNLSFKWKIIAKYFPYEDIFDKNEYFKEYIFRYLISMNYSLIAIKNYSIAMREYVNKFQTFEESDIVNLIPEFYNFTLNEDGSRNTEMQHSIVEFVLNPCVNEGILKVINRKNANVYMPAHRKSDNVRDCGEIEID